MGSDLGLWAYHRRLTEEIKAHEIKSRNDQQFAHEAGLQWEDRGQRCSVRTESESSVEGHGSGHHEESANDADTHHEGNRRFSLASLFSRKGKNK